jgi:polysaccharide pyruvyl transferase WcaK-like protein
MKNKIFELHSFIQSRHKQPRSCVVFGNFGALNFGDEAILSGELEQLLKNEELKVTIVAKYPDIVKKLHGVDSIYFLNLFGIVLNLITTDFVIVGGGGLFCKSSSGIKGKLFQIYFILLFILFPKLIGKHVFVFFSVCLEIG